MNLIFPSRHSHEITALLESNMRKSTIEVRKLERSKMLLYANESADNTLIGKLCNCSSKTIRKWRKRGIEYFDAWLQKEVKPDLDDVLLNLFEDAYRSGTPRTYSSDQICIIISIVLDKPKLSGRPITHWTIREIADEANKRGVTTKISESTVYRILKHADIKPHLSRYWLNPKIYDKEEFNKIVQTICNIYLSAIPLAKVGTRVVSVDEKSGMQIIKRIVENKPVIKGSVEKIEHEYKRNGTITLMAAFDVATGKIIESSMGPTRNETDFVNHIRNTISTDPKSNWIFIMDNLNTHMSEELTIEIAKLIGFKDDLGIKEKSGILKSMETRKAFLSNETHSVRIQYTPVHCSWLNQIESWFSRLSQKVLRRGSFATAEILISSVKAFIIYFNDTMAKPYKWTYTVK